MTDTSRRAHPAWHLAGALALATMALTSAVPSRALEIIPSLGVTKSTDANAGDAQGFGGLAVRTPLMPILNLEGAIGYRMDSFANDLVKVRQWPVTASLWLAPVPAVYVGGGVGWYHTTIDYSSTLPIKDSTSEKMGIHLGGGLDLPLGPKLGLDLNGRYIFMQKDKNNLQVPTTFDPGFWSVSLGLAVKL